jgi:sugar phosphate isomerase/epimerase
MKQFPLSAMLSSLPLDFAAACAGAAELGFTHVDVTARVDRPGADCEVLAETGLLVACAAVGRDLPAGLGLDVAPAGPRREAVELVKRQLADAARLGATRAYLVPGTDPSEEAMSRFAEALSLLSADAAGCMVQLCLEPVPRRALPSAAATLDWLEASGLGDVSLLLDVGHCLISGEDAAAVARRAGLRLGHVHLDDNDGVNDLHQPLFAGRLTRDVLARFLLGLEEIGYNGALAFEFNAQLVDPAAALREGRRELESLMGGEPGCLHGNSDE